MRFAEISPRLALAACVLCAGCASLPESVTKVLPDALRTAPAATAASPATTSAAAAPKAVAPNAPAQADVPVSAATQRAYDDALRALRAGRTDDAERGFKALAQAQPALGGPHANLGLVYRQQGKHAEAVAELERAVAASPQQPQYAAQLGLAYRYTGQFTKARAAYERALELDPSSANATLNFAILNDLYLGDSKRALELYDRYLALTTGGDALVTKWVADLKNRKPPATLVSKKEPS